MNTNVNVLEEVESLKDKSTRKVDELETIHKQIVELQEQVQLLYTNLS